mmetsp:Transcript_8745/g.18153  ORF Transcript_8745/g.18153 Transcript_8745/m.18153 type:complete len:123 (+) Transcript_8745:416-784(+)
MEGDTGDSCASIRKLCPQGVSQLTSTIPDAPVPEKKSDMFLLLEMIFTFSLWTDQTSSTSCSSPLHSIPRCKSVNPKHHLILRFVLPIYLPIFSQEKCNRYAFIVAGKDLSIESCLFLDLQG